MGLRIGLPSVKRRKSASVQATSSASCRPVRPSRPAVRVIFNPGGSNERFARANFKQAKLTLHGENVTIFDEILANRADVFVTESAEAITQQKLKPGLCAINPDKPLQYGEMAWLLPRDDVAFKSYVDQWLHLSQAGGEFQRVMDRWLK